MSHKAMNKAIKILFLKISPHQLVETHGPIFGPITKDKI